MTEEAQISINQPNAELLGVIEIPLTRGYVALVDAIDVDLLEHNWYVALKESGYALADHGCFIEGKWRTVGMHIVILERILGRVLLPGEECDHRDRHGLNNRRGNLRLASRQENNRNQGLRSDNKSGVRGVYWNKARGKWQVYIHVDGHFIHLGMFSDKADAILARKTSETEYFGEFAPVNSGDE